MVAEGGRIDFMFLAPLPLTWPLDPLLHNVTEICCLCCDIRQKNTLGKNRIKSLFVFSTRDPNYKNDIQLFLKQFEKSGVIGDTN